MLHKFPAAAGTMMLLLFLAAAVASGLNHNGYSSGGSQIDILSLMLDSNMLDTNEISDMSAAAAPEIPEAVVADSPPPHEMTARMARYVLHNANWASVATISSRPEIFGFPFANVFSVSDGATLQTSSGVPYMYLSKMEMSVKDLKHDKRASMTVSLAQGTYCDSNQLDPEDPRCAHVILTGHMETVRPGSDEEAFARKALFKRHPEMPSWPTDHGWFFAKMNMSSILVLDFFGGAKTVSLEDYFKAKPY